MPLQTSVPKQPLQKRGLERSVNRCDVASFITACGEVENWAGQAGGGASRS